MHVPAVTTKPPKGFGDYTTKVQYDRTYVWQTVRPRCMLPTTYQREKLVMSSVGANHPSAAETRACTLFLSNAVQGVLYGAGGKLVDTDLYNKAYERLIGRVRSSDMRRGGDSASAELGTALLEYGKTRKFVADGLEAIASYTAAISLGSDRRIADARRRVLESRRKKRRKLVPLTRRQERFLIQQRWVVPRWLGSRWLEYWMVVAPTIGDIHSSLQVLSRDVHQGGVFATASDRGNYRFFENGWFETIDETLRVTATVRLGANLTVSNGNRVLAQSLGLLNPLVIVGEALPWTWFVGWFVNWKQVFNSWTDFSGYDVSKTYQTRFLTVEGNRYHLDKITRDSTNTKLFGFAINRTAGGITYPKLQFSVPEALSWSRAATAISLVVNLLTQR